VTHVFVSPHPDDAALSCGGLIAKLRDRGEPVTRQRGYDEARIGELREAKTLERGAFGMGYFLIKAE
jgi:hypothetical protein